MQLTKRSDTIASQGRVSASVIAHLGIEKPAEMKCSSLKAPMTVVRLQSDAAAREDYADLPRDDAWIFRLHLRDLSAQKLWLDGRPLRLAKCIAGSVSLYDVQRPLAVSIIDALDVVRIFVPRAALDELADELRAKRVTRLEVVHGAALHDVAIHALILSLLPVMQAPHTASGLFVDHVILALLAHIGKHYAAIDMAPQSSRGGLAPWQERHAKEILAAHLRSGIRLAALAEACGLSSSHFARAFKQSTGESPHRWLLHCRVTRAKELIGSTSTTLAEAALACGFADQSHFSRVFEQIVGTPPGAWRRRLKS